MKLRWTDERSYAEVFEANDVASFIDFQVVFERNHGGTLDALHDTDAAQMQRSAENWWRGVYDSWRWSAALNAMIMTVCDALGRESC